MSNEKMRFGEHEVWFDSETGFGHLTFIGVLDEPELVQINEVFAGWQKKAGPGEPTFVMVDNRRSDGISRDGRKAMASMSRPDADVYCAIHGASFAVRVVLNLVFKATALTSKNATIVRYESSESEAREWLNSHQQAYLARKR